MSGIRWGEDPTRDCAELRRLESWGIYPHGHHASACPLLHDTTKPPSEGGNEGSARPMSEDVGRLREERIAMGRGDDLDVETGRCCPTCRHDLTPHNKTVWEAGYAVSQRHMKEEVAMAWDEGQRAAYGAERDGFDGSEVPNPYRAGRANLFARNQISAPREGSDFDWAMKVNRASHGDADEAGGGL